MSSMTPKNIINGTQLTTGAVTYYTVAANLKCMSPRLTFTNTTGSARTVTVYWIKSGGAAGDSNTITKTRTIPANDYWICDVLSVHTMETGDFIQALADAATAVTIFGSGLEVSV